MNKVFYVVFTIVLLLSARTNAQRAPFYEGEDVKQSRWADSVMKSLSLDEKLGQLFMVAAFSNKDEQHVQQIADLIKKYNIGGLCFFQGGPVRQAKLTNYYQSLAKTKLMIGIDGEWGLAMRLDSTIRFPRQMTLGAVHSPQLVYKMGAEIARQCQRMGIHLNLAPVADINDNPLNPVISNRSFGEAKRAVTENAVAYMQGLQENGVMACGKHFPGHGNTTVDSHKALPIITQSYKQLDSLEFYPFRGLINEGISSMMIAHLYVPSLDSTLNLPSTLSKRVVTDLLRNKMGYNGLILTDALNMKAVSATYKPGELDVKALLAGNDVLLYSEDVPTAMAQIKMAIANKQITEEEIDAHVERILKAKYWCGLNKYAPIEMNHLLEDLNTTDAKYLNQRLFEKAMTLLINKQNIIPLRDLEKYNLASVVVGDSVNIPFNAMLQKYDRAGMFSLNKDANKASVDSLVDLLQPYNMVIVSVYNTSTNPEKRYGITDATLNLIAKLKDRCKVIIDVFGNPYTLAELKGWENAEAVLLSYEGTPEAQAASVQLLFGALKAQGTLPVSASDMFKITDGLVTDDIIRLKYTLPEELNIPSDQFSRIDSIANRAIRAGATPGCQVLVAVDGKVIYEKAFGYTTVEKTQKVKVSDVYDIASVTKIAATTLELMKLYEQKKLGLDDKISKYLPELKKSNKKNVVVRDMLAHQAGFVAWIPFWKTTFQDGQALPYVYSDAQGKSYPFRVAEGLYLSKYYQDSIWNRIVKSAVSNDKKYLYSDLDFILGADIVERQTKKHLDELVESDFYKPMGLSTMGYSPRKRMALNRIVPTENDHQFRKQLLQGDVHDPAAAMMGGVAGHAGIFSNASDLATLMQMLLNKGEYGGHQYLDAATVAEFTRTQFAKNGNRRGLGFDKAEADPGKASPTCKSASANTFGHQGFTGTCVWADPDQNLIYVFLSNRVNPDADNEKLVKMNVRTDIQQVIYDAVSVKQ